MQHPSELRSVQNHNNSYGLERNKELSRLLPQQLGFVNVLSRRAVDEAIQLCINEGFIGDPIVVKTGRGRVVGKDVNGNDIWRRWPARRTLRMLRASGLLTITLPADFMKNRDKLDQTGRQGLLATKEVIKYFEDVHREEGLVLEKNGGKLLRISITALWWRMTHHYALVPCGGEMSHQAEGYHHVKKGSHKGEVLLVEREGNKINNSRKRCFDEGLMWKKAIDGERCDNNYIGPTMCTHAIHGYPCYGPPPTGNEVNAPIPPANNQYPSGGSGRPHKDKRKKARKGEPEPMETKASL